MLHDSWLTRWRPLAVEHAGNGPILEIGFGKGDDTATLCATGLVVRVFDFSSFAVAMAKVRTLSVTIERRGTQESLPAETEKFGVIVVSLALHYFTWTETVAIA